MGAIVSVGVLYRAGGGGEEGGGGAGIVSFTKHDLTKNGEGTGRRVDGLTKHNFKGLCRCVND